MVLNLSLYTYPGGPVGHSEEVLGEEGVPLECIDGTMMATVHGHDLLRRRLRLPIAADDRPLLSSNHELSRLHKTHKLK